MNKILLVIALVCGCFLSGYSQLNQHHKKERALNDLPSFQFMPELGYKPAEPTSPKTDGQALTDQLLTRKEGATSAQEPMPCYKPEGIFSMRVVKPDTAITHTMPVKKF